MMADTSALTLPRRIGDYDIFYDIILGHGSLGSVCVGRDTQNNRDVAIKHATSYRPRTELCINRELKALQSISHQHITKLLYHERVRNHTYFVLELCNKDLQLFAHENPELYDLKMQFTEEFAMAVQCLHDNGIIHRDIKPENVLLKWSAGSWITKMSDLGLSRYMPKGSTACTATAGVGTWPWMAPELIPTDGHAKYTKSADTYSLGLLNLSVADYRPGEALDAITGNKCNGFVVKIHWNM